MFHSITDLTGAYAPIYLGEPLFKFFNNTNKFGSIDPIDRETNMFSTKLMDFLPCVKAGFASYNSITLLFYIYLKNNNLREKENSQFFHFDDFMDEIFIEMKAEFYADANNNKIFMTEAIEREIINEPLSTQEVIRLKRPEFNKDYTAIKERDGSLIYRKACPNYYISLLLAYNCYNKKQLLRYGELEILETLKNEDLKRQMVEEHNIIPQTFQKWIDW
jgi:hypothetical protein